MEILLCTDGSPAAEQAALMILRLKYPAETRLTLLGLAEDESDRVYLETSISQMSQIISADFPNHQSEICFGPPADQILMRTEQQHYHLIAIGERGHHQGLALLRRSFNINRLTRKLHTPLLVARKVPRSIQSILICTGAEAPSVNTIREGGRLVANSGSKIALLHVMSQVALTPASLRADLMDTAKSAIKRKTREGLHLLDAIELLQKVGVHSEVKAVLRHGLVVEEVLKEIEEKGCDLLVIGAHQTPDENRWLEFLLDDIAGRLLARCPCSVLVI
jgi:nucleotide-binding universal stress UspA family protein